MCHVTQRFGLSTLRSMWHERWRKVKVKSSANCSLAPDRIVEATNATDHTEIYRDALMPPYATLCHLPVSSPIHTYSTYIHLRYATYTAYAPAGSCLVLFGLMRYACRIVSGFPSSGSFEALLRSWRLRKAEEDRGHLTPETMETTQMLVGVLGLLGGGGHQTFSSDSL